MFETFSLRLAAGLALALFALPPRTVAARFFRIQFVIILGIAAGAGLLGWENPHPDGYWMALGLGMGAALVGPVLWSPHAIAVGYACVGIVSGSLFLAAAMVPNVPWSLLGASTEVLSGTLLGLATTAMLMGHWYLIAPTMSTRPLLILLVALMAACGLRALVAAWALTVSAGVISSLHAIGWLWLATRWGAGLLGVGVLTWMAWQAARIRSTQSATGILYVVVIFAFMGELTDVLVRESLERPFTERKATMSAFAPRKVVESTASRSWA